MKQLAFILSLFGFLVLTVAAASADHSHGYQMASDAYSTGDYATAVQLWGEEAERGEVEAQEMLGAM